MKRQDSDVINGPKPQQESKMRFNFKDREIYVNPGNISSVAVNEDKDWDTKAKIYHVEITINGMIARIATSSTEAEAKELVQKIGATLDKVEPEKTYLDGFKDGTEYALRLIGLQKKTT